jgi:hypothetical protein
MCQERALVNAFHYVWHQPINLIEEKSTGVQLQNYKNFLEYKNFSKENSKKVFFAPRLPLSSIPHATHAVDNKSTDK